MAYLVSDSDQPYTNTDTPGYMPVYTELTSVHGDSQNSTWQNGQVNVCALDAFEINDGNDNTGSSDISMQSSVYTSDHRTVTSTYTVSYVNELDKVKDRPKDILIEEIRRITGDNVPDLEMLRSALFVKACNRDDFPCKEGQLRRRLEARSLSAASAQTKLSRDCYVLLRACDGEFTEELSEVVHKKPKKVESISGTPKPNREGDDMIGLKSLKETIVILQRDMHELKTNQNVRMETLTGKLNDILKEKENAQNRAQKFKSEIKELKTKVLTLEKMYNENQVSLVNLEKSNKNLQQETNEQKDVINGLKKTSENMEKNIGDNAKTVQILERKCKKTNDTLEKKLNQVKSDVAKVTEMSTDYVNLASRYDNEQLNGVASLKNTVKLTSDSIKSYESDIIKLQESVKSCSTCVVALKRQHDDLKKTMKKMQVSSIPKSQVTHVVPARLTEHATDTSEDGSRVQIQPTVSTTNRFAALDTNNTDESETSGYTTRADNSNPASIPQRPPTSTKPKEPSPDNDSSKPSYSDVVSTIGVHFPSSVCSTSTKSMADKFTGYKRPSKNKVSRFYIHGINKATSSENAMRDYLHHAGVRFTFLRYFDNNWKRTAAAQLNVISDDEHVVSHVSFWPDGIMVRPWLPREAFWNEHRHG